MASSRTDQLRDRLVYSRAYPPYYRIRAALHRSRRAAVRSDLAPLASILRKDAVVATSLSDLDLQANRAFRAAVEPVVERLRSTPFEIDTAADRSVGRNTHLHCLSVDAAHLAVFAPEVLLWGVDEDLLAVIESYVGVTPALTNVHVRRDVGLGQGGLGQGGLGQGGLGQGGLGQGGLGQGGLGQGGLGQGGLGQVGTRIWHRDTEDQRVIRTVVYLTDVGIDDGPFEYIARRDNGRCRGLEARAFRAAGDPILDEEMAHYVPAPEWRQIVGPAGTVAIADNAALYHHGRPHCSERIAVFYTHTSRHPRYPRAPRNPRFDTQLTGRQRAAFRVATASSGS